MSEAENKVLFFEEVGKLKHIERAGWVLREVFKPERVAGHMYRMAVMAMALKPIEGCDMDKVVKLALVHDMAECKVGDLTPHDNVSVDEKHKLESDAMSYLGGLLPPTTGEKFINLYEEYEKHESIESRTTKDLDLFDMVLQAFEYEKSELERKNSIPDLGDFFNENRVVGRIKNEEVKSWTNEVLKQRQAFLVKHADKVDQSPNLSILNGTA